MNAVLLGGTRGIGRALARRLAARGERICLLGRDEAELARSAADLEARGAAGRVLGVRCDLSSPESVAPALEAAARELGVIDLVVLSAAAFASQEELEADLEQCARLLDVDFTQSILFCERARTHLAERGGTLCVFASVAGDRARKPVALYGAAKAGLAHYLDGLDLRYRDRGLRVVAVKPGFVRTGMTAGLPEPPFAASADAVAACAIRGIDRGRRVVYAPSIWRALMAVIRALPRPLLRRASF